MKPIKKSSPETVADILERRQGGTTKRLTITEKRIKEQKEKILEEVSKTYIVSIACQKTGISRATLYRWIESDLEFNREFKKRQREGVSAINDLAESQLIMKIKNGDSRLIIYWLSNRHQNYINPQNAIIAENQNKGLTVEQKIGIAKRLQQWKTDNLHTDTDYTTNPAK